jgi:hypothetical protein
MRHWEDLEVEEEIIRQPAIVEILHWEKHHMDPNTCVSPTEF